MSEVIYRAWDTTLNQMLPNIQNHIGDGPWAFGNMINDERYIIMQYTGLDDKGGNKIFERDILNSDNVKPELRKSWCGVITFITGCYCVKTTWSTNPLYEDNDNMYVVGNEFEQSHLLED